MKGYHHTILFALLLFCAGGCQKKESIREAAPKPERQLSIQSGSDGPRVVRLSKDTVYELMSNLQRDAGQQLIIEAGTVIRVRKNTNININEGAVIIANGTAEDPIVFTSNERPGRQTINWGALAITGRSVSNNNQFGTPAPDDNSGSMQYVRIEFGNLLLTNVGSRTVLDHIQVSYNGADPAAPDARFDQAFLFDGGTVNARNLIAYASGGITDFAIRNGYTGNLQNILAYRHPFFGGRRSPFSPTVLCAVLIENNPNQPDAQPLTRPVISNLTVLGPNAQPGTLPAYLDTLRPNAALICSNNARFQIRNSVLAGFRTAWHVDDTATLAAVNNRTAAVTFSLLQNFASSKEFTVGPGLTTSNLNSLRSAALLPASSNQALTGFEALQLQDPFNYIQPNPLPRSESLLLNGANFSGPDFSVTFFNRVSYRGALGATNWGAGWVNFNPLGTNYNFPE